MTITSINETLPALPPGYRFSQIEARGGFLILTYTPVTRGGIITVFCNDQGREVFRVTDESDGLIDPLLPLSLLQRLCGVFTRLWRQLTTPTRKEAY